MFRRVFALVLQTAPDNLIRTNQQAFDFSWIFLFITIVLGSNSSLPQNKFPIKLEKIENFQLKIHNKLEDVRIRRRSTFEEDSYDSVPFVTARESEILSSGHSVAVTTVVNVNGNEVALAGTEEGNIVLYHTDEFVTLFSFPPHEQIYSLLSFQFGNGLWLVGLHNRLQVGHLLQVYECNNTAVLNDSALVRKQHINVPGDSLITLVNIKNRIHLVLVTNTDQDSVLRLYIWTGTQFDKIFSSSLKGNCKSLAAWESDKILYMAISLFNKNQLQILQLKENEDNLVSVLQIFKGSFNLVYHFVSAGSQYLVCERENKLVFYWWNGLHFRGQQEISFSDSETVADISILVIARILVVVVVKPSRLEYYVQDSSVSFTKSGSTELPEFLRIKSARIWKKDDVFRLLPVFQDSREAVWFKLDIQFRGIPADYEATRLVNCTSEVDDILYSIEDQLGEVSSKLNKVWMKNNISAIPIVEVEGNVVAETANIRKLSFTSDATSVLSLLKLNQQLLNKVNEVQFSLNDTLRRSGYQEINGHYNFAKSLNATEVNINSFETNLQINGVQSSSLHSVLTTKGDQRFYQNITIGSASTKLVNTDLLNYKEISDYLLLKNRRQIMRGNTIFKNITVEHINKTHTLNKMNVSEIVTSSTPQIILDKKVFSLLSSKIITLKGLVNGECMKKFKDTVCKMKFDEKLSFNSNTVVTNITIKSFNGYDFADLLFQSVKQSENYGIKGFKKFTQPVLIQDELSASTINGLYLNNLMTLDSNQNISADLLFPNVSFSEVETHLVNGIDLCNEAVKKTGYFEVNKGVYFKQPLKAVNITMEDGATIDEVDLSNLVPQIMRKNNATFYSALELDNVHVLNDLIIEDENIALLLSNLSKNAWLKTKSQDIPFGQFETFPIKQLHLNTWNAIPIGDIVLRNLVGDIDSAKSFEDVEVNSITIKDGKNLNGIDISSQNLYPLITDAVEHFKVNDVLIEGDLDLSSINYINISDLMQSQAFQYSDGRKEFNSIYVDELIASDLNFTAFETESFEDYISGAAHPLKNMIVNKNFKFINGEELDFQGFLNGRTFDEMFQSIVTLNSNQNISSYAVFSKIKAKELLIKDLEKMIDFNNIIVRDWPQSNISRKKIVGFVKANNIAVDGTINDVNLNALQINAFSKEGNNTVFKPITFQSSLKATGIQILPSTTLDDVIFGDLIPTDQDLYVEYMNTSTISTQNVDISGKINGCDLLDIYDGDGDFETLTPKNFIDLNIVGNLHIKSTLNDISEADFSKIAFALDSNYLKGNFYFPSISAEYIQTPFYVNGMDIQFILEDAVRQQTEKDIHGKKKFRKNIFSNKTSVNFLNVTSICGLNIPLLYRKYVSKGNPQNLYIKNIQHIKARNIAIMGLLNGVKLPADLVLIDTDETLSSAVFWNDTMTLASNLSIGGLINGKQLPQFLDRIVNLESPDVISSNLIFLEDSSFQGDAEIDFVNKVAMNETVTRLEESFIQGTKTFQGNLSILSGLNISGSVNNILLDALSENVCRTAADESIVDPVTFSNIKTYALNVGNINNISLEHLWNHVHDIEEYIFTTIDRLTSEMNHGEETISVIKDHDGQFSLYGFFELYQVLNLGPTIRCLPLFESGMYGDTYGLPTVEMIVWVERNFSCRSFKSVVMKVNSDGTLSEKEKINARVFPFSLRILDEDVQGFSLYTDRNNRCKVGDPKPDFIKTIFLGGNESKNAIDSPSKSVVTEAKLLEMDSGVYILIIYHMEGDGERIYLHKYNLMSDTWTLWQKFHSEEVTSYDIIFVDDTKISEVCLAVTGDTKSGLFLYNWNYDTEKFFLKTSSSKSISSAVKWVSTEKEVFLMLSKEKTKIRKDHGWTFEYIDPVEILILLDDLQLHHELNLQGINSFEEFDLAGETFVLAVSRHLQTIYVIQYKGFHGFKVIQQINAPGVQEVTVFSTTNEDLLLAISSITGHTRILKCVKRSSKAIVP